MSASPVQHGMASLAQATPQAVASPAAASLPPLGSSVFQSSVLGGLQIPNLSAAGPPLSRPSPVGSLGSLGGGSLSSLGLGGGGDQLGSLGSTSCTGLHAGVGIDAAGAPLACCEIRLCAVAPADVKYVQ